MDAAQKNDGIFSAYSKQQPRRPKRMLLLYPAAALFLFLLGKWFVALQPAATPYRVETAWGLRQVNKGMSPQDVSGILGQPTSKERRGNQECFQYGRPTIKEPTFVLHVVCYEDGKLIEVSEKRYNSWVVTSDMAISPAPLEYELQDEPKPEAPASPSAPSVAGQNPM
ncbi:hypothetical protein [Archangium lansingense]|uniref:Outer membrane protein assembly factor BamE n=2 Tax=Archangium lansingense TaxID=2995310 RepID=A0ABT4A137_9BACT|nr:hypothetical protein [Archangium lansinium]MCY1075343.1 hypothetical protein [Archangium lansinium]